MNKKVCMLVRNPVTRDARVLKEANTLIKLGYHVKVIGIQDAQHFDAQVVLENGLEVHRVPWKAQRAEWMYALMVGFGLLGLLLSFILAPLLGALLQSLLHSFVHNGPVFLRTLVDNTGVILVTLILLAVFRIYFRKLLKIRRIIDFERKRENLQDDVDGRGGSLFSKLVFAIAVSPKKAAEGLHKSFTYLLNQVLSYFSYNAAALKVAKQFEPDLVHAHDIATLPAGVQIKGALGCKLIYDAHELYEEAVGVPAFGRFLYRYINNRYLNRENLDGFITINHSFIDFYRTRYPDSPDATLVMNATVRFDEVSYDGRLHSLAGVDESKKIVLFQGGFSKKRGIEALLSAAPFLEDDWVMVFMGWGFYEDKIAKASEKFPSKVFMIPPAPQSELPLWTSGATVGVIPYQEHGLNHKYCTPNKLWEYPNAGVPILASPRVELKKMVESYETGKILSEPIDPKQFAEEMMFDEHEVEYFKQKCKAFIEQNSWSTYEGNIKSLYERILN